MTPVIPGDIEALMASNLLVENKTNWRTNMQHTCVTIYEDCTIFTERVGD